MSAQKFRHRENEEWRAKSRPESHASREATHQEGRETPTQTPPPTAPCTPSNAPLFPEAIELGSAASLFRIAQSRPQPNSQTAVEALRLRMKQTLAQEEQSTVPARTALRDRLTTTDSLWIPTLKAVAALIACALLAAGVYGVIEWLQPASPQPAAVAGTAIAFLMSF